MMKNEKGGFIKLAIIEDEKLFSQLLVKLFEGLDGFRIVLQVKDGSAVYSSVLLRHYTLNQVQVKQLLAVIKCKAVNGVLTGQENDSYIVLTLLSGNPEIRYR
jgi:hypothetical protein